MTIKLALADDHNAMRGGLGHALETAGPFKVIMHAENGLELLDQLSATGNHPHVCLLDLKMPVMDGFETLKAIRKKYPDIRVLVYSMFLEEYNILRIYKYGAQGAFSKEHGLIELMTAINEVLNEDHYIPPEVPKTTAEKIRKHQISIPKITPRELEFLKLYCDGLPYKEIAEKMNISVKTVDTYREHISEKFGISSRIGLLLFILKTGIVGWNI